MSAAEATLGRAVAAACGDRGVLARIGGALGVAARAEAAALAQLGASEARTRRAVAAAAVRSPVPAGLRGIDASWIEAALAGLPPRARDALAAGPSDAIGVWLARWAAATLPALPSLEPARARPTEVADVARLAPAAILAWLEEVGLDQLAFALGAHAPAAIARVGARLADAIARIGRAPRGGQLGPRRQAVARARRFGEPGGPRLVELGARALAPHLDAATARQLVHRLPRPVGLELLDELDAHRPTAGVDAPAWSALIAP